MTQNDPDELWIAQLRIVAGHVADDAPQVAFAERRDAVGRLVRLVILAEAVSPGGEAFIGSLVERIGNKLDLLSRSMTGALKAVILDRHEELRRWNREHLPAEHATYGLSCLLLREGEPAVLAQTGPSLALLAGDLNSAGIRLLDTRDHSDPDPVAAPLGGAAPITIEFRAAPEAADGWGLLLSANAAPILDARRRVALARLAVDDLLPNLHPQLLELRDAAALAVAFPASLPDQPTSTPAHDPPDDHPFAAPTSETPDAPQDAAAIDIDPPAPAAPDPPPADPPPPAPAAAMKPQLQPIQPDQPDQPPEAAAWPPNPFAVRDAPVLAVAAATTAPISAGQALINLGGSLPSLSAPDPDRSEDIAPLARRRNLERSRRSSNRRALLLLVGMALALAAVAAALLIPAWQSSGDDAYTAALERARAGLAAAELADDTDAARTSLEQAQLDIDAALERNPLAAEALDLRAQVEARLTNLRLIQPPVDLATLVDLGRYGPSIAAGALQLGGGALFALDDAGGRVFAVSDDGVASVVFNEGAPLDPSGDSVAGRPLSIAWGDALWILDDRAQLFRWTPADILLVPLPGSVRLGSIDAVAASDNDIYILDAQGGAVWRFAVDPVTRALTPPVRVIDRTDLLSADELAIRFTDSGRLELLIAGSDGRLRRFLDGVERPVADDGLDRELLAPASLTPAAGDLWYVADRGAGRILALRPDVGLAAQIEAPELADVRGVAVDEASGRIFYALPDAILVSRLARPAE